MISAAREAVRGSQEHGQKRIAGDEQGGEKSTEKSRRSTEQRGVKSRRESTTRARGVLYLPRTPAAALSCSTQTLNPHPGESA